MSNKNNIKNNPELYKQYKHMLDNKVDRFVGYYYIFNGDNIIKFGYTHNIFNVLQYCKYNHESFDSYCLYTDNDTNISSIFDNRINVSWDLDGLYYLFRNDELIYIGSTVDLFYRLFTHSKHLKFDAYYFRDDYYDLTDDEASEIVKYSKYFNLENSVMPSNSRFKSAGGIANEIFGYRYTYYRKKVEKVIDKYNIPVVWVGARKLRNSQKQHINYYDFIKYEHIFRNEL